MRFLFQHGWGFSEECWGEWLPILHSPYTLGNRGYWGLPRRLDHEADQTGFMLVCHSLGLHLLPRELLLRAEVIVVIGGFAHFHGLTPAAGRFSRKHVKRMQSRMQTGPAELIEDFYRDCACGDWPVNRETMNQALLIEDLILLDKSRLAREHCAGLPPVLLLHGREDRIVPPERGVELSELLDRHQLTVIDDAGHGLPFTHPRLCLDIIRAFRAKFC